MTENRHLKDDIRVLVGAYLISMIIKAFARVQKMTVAKRLPTRNCAIACLKIWSPLASGDRLSQSLQTDVMTLSNMMFRLDTLTVLRVTEPHTSAAYIPQKIK